MTEPSNTQSIIEHIRARISAGEVRVTQHGHREMVADGFTLDEVFQALRNPEVLENYPEHQRGACCLVHGIAPGGRHVHVVCTTAQTMLIIITVYEPKMPKWRTPMQRNRP